MVVESNKFSMRYLLLCTLWIISFSIEAQDSTKISYQVNAGALLAIPYKNEVVFKQPGNYPGIVKYQQDVGCFFEMWLVDSMSPNSNFSGGIEFSWSRLATQSYFYHQNFNGTLEDLRCNVPLVFNFKISHNPPVYLGIGGYLNIPVFVDEKGSYVIDTVGLQPSDHLLSIKSTGTYHYGVMNHYKAIDAGLIVQAEYDYCLNTKFTSVFFSRFNYGLINTLKRDISYVWRNYSLLFGIG